MLKGWGIRRVFVLRGHSNKRRAVLAISAAVPFGSSATILRKARSQPRQRGFDGKADCYSFVCRSARRTGYIERHRHADPATRAADIGRRAGPVGLQ